MLDISQSKLDLIITIAIIFLLIVMLYNHRRSSSTAKVDSAELGVKDLIEKVKSELIEMEQNREREGKAALFELKDFDLEINFVVKAVNKESGQAEFKVITVGGETESDSEKAQKIKLHMTVVQPQNRKTKASKTPPQADESAMISDPLPKEKK
ncbi:MAG TPA: trypco2 family protein [Blastocatellia bacterium]|nr:trypco2 family protein [Blastocatellia bacterium]